MRTQFLKEVGVYDGEAPPVPIPNTVVKLVCAYNTWLDTARDDWSMLTQNIAAINTSLKCLWLLMEYLRRYARLAQSVRASDC